MAAPTNSTEFLDLVRKSGVADEKRLDAHLQSLRARGPLPTEPGKMAGVLVRDGLVTRFQAEQILQGKWRRFTIGKYKVLESLGSGGMGNVFLCEHKLMRRRVAVKVLPTAKAADQSALERFYREARAAAALDHPNIVHAYDIDQDETLHFLVMEYVDGANLQELIKKTGPLDPARAAHYIRQAALGLDHAHRAGLVHRDIKPGNILVDRTGVVKVLDMGLARFFNDEEDILTRKYDENVLGTADYLSPEQVEDSHTVDIRADIYSLGLTFYFLLSGRPPFGEGTTAQKLIWQRNRHPRPLTSFRPDVPAAMAAVIDRMVAKEPAERYQSPTEVIDALEPWTQGPFAPPAEREMPQLSPAIAPPNAAEPTTVTSQPSSVQPTTPRKNWQVIGGAATKPPSSTDLPQAAPPPPPRPAAPAPPSRDTRGQATPAIKAPPAPATVGTAAPTEEEESIPWEQVTSDTEDLTGKADTAPRSDERGRPASGRRGRVAPEAREGRRFWLLAALFAVVVAGLVVGAGVLFGWFDPLFGPRPAGPTRQTLRVTRQAGQTGTHRSLKQALEQAKPGDRIVLLDPEHREQLRLEGSRFKELSIEPAEGVEVVWRVPVQGSSVQPLLDLVNVRGVQVRKIRFDGEGRVEKVLRVSGVCPGLKLTDVAVEGFTRTGLSVANCAGDPNHPVEILRMIMKAPPKGAEAAVLFTSLPRIQPPENAHLLLKDCRFEGTYKLSAVKFLQPPGPGVRFENVTPEVRVPGR